MAESSPKREAILAAALELFVERGFHGTAVPAVAERAGVGAGTIYRYFESKEELVNVLYRRWKETLSGTLLEDFDQSLPARQQFARFWQRMTEFVGEHPKAFAFLELHHHGSYLDEESRAIEQRLLEMASSLVSSMQAAGEVKSGPTRVLMSVVYWSFVGVVKSAWDGLFELTEENLRVAEACAWDAIRAHSS